MTEDWLKDYHSRIIEEYNFSMERKDKVTDWIIGVFFVSLVAYSELLGTRARLKVATYTHTKVAT